MKGVATAALGQACFYTEASRPAPVVRAHQKGAERCNSRTIPAQPAGSLRLLHKTSRAVGPSPVRATAAAPEQERLSYGTSQFDEHGDDYYSILGVPPGAPPNVIKASYYKAIRECHPDLTGVDEDTATEFCIFLNEIYEVGRLCGVLYTAVASPSAFCHIC